METSAKNSNNVDQSFQKIAHNVLEKLIMNQSAETSNKNRFKLKEGDKIKIPSQYNNGCC